MQTNKITFTEPRICDHGGDLSKNWYVYFSCTDCDRGETKQFRYKLGINRIKDLKKRKKAAKEALNTIKEMLYNDGFNPFNKSVQNEKKLLLDYLRQMLEIKKQTSRARTRQTYKHAIDLLGKWLSKSNMDFIEVNNLTKADALKFADYLVTELNYKGKTVNGTIGYLKSMFYMLIDRDIAKSNPFTAVKKLKEDEGKNVAFTPYEVDKITDYLKKHDIRLYYATQFVRYGFIRRTELTGIRVRDINLFTHTITIQSEFSKTRKQDSVTIPKSLEKIILEMGLENADPDDFVFGRGLNTCKNRLRRVADMSDAHKCATDALGLRKELIFYGWKHTGCVELYNKVKDPYVVCRQCRHSDIRMTMRYMRSLGLGINEAVRDW